MKRTILSLILILVIQVQSVLAASPEEEARFVAAVKQSFEKHDVDALMALTYWGNVPDKFKESGKKQYARDVSQTSRDIALSAPNPKYPDVEWKDSDGVLYRSNLPVVKQLKITFVSGAKIDTKIGSLKVRDAVYPVGEKDGRLYLLEPAPVK